MGFQIFANAAFWALHGSRKDTQQIVSHRSSCLPLASQRIWSPAILISSCSALIDWDAINYRD
jgi:hypothetical protein